MKFLDNLTAWFVVWLFLSQISENRLTYTLRQIDGIAGGKRGCPFAPWAVENQNKATN